MVFHPAKVPSIEVDFLLKSRSAHCDGAGVQSSGGGKVDFTRQFHSRHFYNKYKIMFRDTKIEPFIIVETCSNMQAKIKQGWQFNLYVLCEYRCYT